MKYKKKNFFLKKIIFSILFFVFFNLEAKTICLNMIVKNEAHCIKRCLTSVKPLTDYWVIVDTGSTDGTQKVIKDFLKDIPGELHERPWKNFCHNRQEALELAKDTADYIFFIDADDCLVFEKDFKRPPLDKDFYYISIKDSSVKYKRKFLINTKLDWQWKGVLHNYLILNKNTKNFKTLENVKYKRNYDGARSKDPQKYHKNAKILEEILKKEPNNKRYQFYLAESYKDAKRYNLAIKNYKKRILMKGWGEDVFWSMLQIAKIQQRLKKPKEQFLTSYYDAYLYRPTRIESLYYIANYYRKNKKYLFGYIISKLGSHIRSTSDISFTEDWIYKYGLLLEFSICAYYSKKYDESKKASLEILKTKNIPDNIQRCVERNLQFAYEKIKMNSQKNVPSLAKSIKLRKTPWLTEKSIEFLEEFFKKNKNAKVLEFGSGASTVWIAKRTKNLTSVEHDIKWFNFILNKLETFKDVNKINYILYPKPYYRICSAFEDNSFDLIIVDGRNRKGCFSHSLRLLKPGGVIMLDNSERPYYHDVFSLVKNWKSVITTQKNPDKENFWYEGWETRWWHKPKS